jgi:hypothetical protein
MDQEHEIQTLYRRAELELGACFGASEFSRSDDTRKHWIAT